MSRKKRTTRPLAKTARRSKPTPKARRAARPVYSEATLRGLSLDQSQARSAALEALSLMRSRGFSLTRAAREVELTRDAVRHWTGASIRKQGRRFVAKSSDKLVRIMKVITPRGMQSEAIFDSRVASKLGAYNAAVKEALRGNLAALKSFRDAIVEGAALAAKDPALARTAIGKYVKVPPEILATMQIATLDPVVTEKQISDWINILAQQGMLKAAEPASKALAK